MLSTVSSLGFRDHLGSKWSRISSLGFRERAGSIQPRVLGFRLGFRDRESTLALYDLNSFFGVSGVGTERTPWVFTV